MTFFLITVLIVDSTEKSKHVGLCARAFFMFLWRLWFRNLNRFQHFLLLPNDPSFPLQNTHIDNLSNQRISPFHINHFSPQKIERRWFLDISQDYIRLTVALFYVVSMTTVWVRPPIKPTSAVISSPKSFVIALICILQLSVLAHSKNNQPPLKTGDSIIIISVDLYKTLLTSLCLTLAFHCQASFTTYFHLYTYFTDSG